jgi:hypothetical protein
LLNGTGKLLRQIKFKSVTDYDIDDIKQLITEANAERTYKK